MIMAELTELAKAIADLDKERVTTLVEDGLKNNVTAIEIVNELNTGLGMVGDRFTAGEYFLSELIYSSHIMKGVMERLEPMLGDAVTVESMHKVVIGTVKGDIHDIGKNIVAALLKGAGFEVIDLGVDVPAERFIASVSDSGAAVLGLSALLNFTIPEMKKIVDALVSAGIRDRVKVIIGGAPTDEQVREYTGADYYALDAPTGVKICREIFG